MTGYRMTASRGSVAGVTPVEDDYLWRAYDQRAHGVVLLHGAGAPNQYSGHDKIGSQPFAGALANAGYSCVAGAMKGDAFGNNTVMGEIPKYEAHLVAQTGVTAGKFHYVGTSMGAYTALRYLIKYEVNRAKALSLTLFLPLYDIVGAYNANIGGLQAAIATAWGVTAPNPLPTSADLRNEAPTGTVLATDDIPVQVIWEDSDAVTLPEQTQALLTHTGAVSRMVDPTEYGHTEWAINEAKKTGSGNWSDVINFIHQAEAAA